VSGFAPFLPRQFDRFEDRFERRFPFGQFDRVEDRLERFGFDPFLQRRFGFDPFLQRRFGFDPFFGTAIFGFPSSPVTPFVFVGLNGL
jgi:hypothetical protein